MAGTTVRTNPAEPTMLWGWSQRAWGWWAPAAVAIAAFVLRVWNLARPNRLQFDETYYAKDAWSMLQFGYPRDAVENANEHVINHQVDRLFTNQPEQFVHPPAGKW